MTDAPKTADRERGEEESPSPTVRVLICGGREWRDHAWPWAHLDWLYKTVAPFGRVITGGAPGIDTIAHRWAVKRGIETEVFQADWSREGRAAGPLRNQRMIDQGRPQLVIAFPGGRGTADMVNRAKAAGVDVITVPNPAAGAQRSELTDPPAQPTTQPKASTHDR